MDCFNKGDKYTLLDEYLLKEGTCIKVVKNGAISRLNDFR